MGGQSAWGTVFDALNIFCVSWQWKDDELAEESVF